MAIEPTPTQPNKGILDARSESGVTRGINSSQGFQVNRKGFIEMDGEITELLPAASFRVKLSNDHEILAHLSGKMRMNRIRLLPWDKVKVEMSPYDLTKGRISYRY